MNAIGISRGTVYALRKELQVKAWARFDGDTVTNLLGFASKDSESLKNQTNQGQSEKSDCLKNQTVFVESIEDSESLKNQTNQGQSEKSDSKVRKIRLNSLKNQTAYKEQPAKEPAKEPAKGERKPQTVSAVPISIAFVRQLTQRYPDKTLWEKITQTLGEDFDQTKLSECYTAWVGRGYNKMNLSWLFEWYVKGVPGGHNNGRKSSQSRDDIYAAYAARYSTPDGANFDPAENLVSPSAAGNEGPGD
jgi:hypothetical protein